MEATVQALLRVCIPVIEGMGVVAACISAVRAFVRYLRALCPDGGALRSTQAELAEDLALCLEFLITAEILKTMLSHEMRELAALAAIIALRALLSFLIHMEMQQGHADTAREERKK